MGIKPTFQIEYLADHPGAVTILKNWFQTEWAPYYGPDGPGDAERDLSASCNRTGLPIALVAFQHGTVVGTAALKRTSVTTHEHLTPWLAALLVGTQFRRRGVAGLLIEAVEELGRQQGFACLYAGTGEKAGVSETALRNRGWEFLESRPYFVSQVSIFRKTL